MSEDKIKSSIDDYARSKVLKIGKLRDEIQNELDEIKRGILNDFSKGKD